MSATNKKSFNPWPVAIIAFFSVAVCAAVSFVIYCSRQEENLVTTDYYEQEVRYQDQMDRINQAASLQAPARINYDAAKRSIAVALPEDHARQAPKGWVQLYRPSAASLDRKLNLQLDANGVQNIDAATLANGLWHVRVSWTLNGTDYFYDQKLVIGRKQG
jgi:hypothetical protein